MSTDREILTDLLQQMTKAGVVGLYAPIEANPYHDLSPLGIAIHKARAKLQGIALSDWFKAWDEKCLQVSERMLPTVQHPGSRAELERRIAELKTTLSTLDYTIYD